MLVLNKDKEDELAKYGFAKEIRPFHSLDGYYSWYWTYGRAITIEGCHDGKSGGQMRSCNFSRKAQDVIYDLIKKDILVKADNVENRPSKYNKEQMAITIEQLQKRIEELEKKH